MYIEGDENEGLEGVVLDVTPYGMMIRMLDTLAIGTIVRVQLMRDDNFRDTLGAPKDGEVVRHDPASPSGFTDHGVRLIVRKIPKNESRPVNIQQRPVSGPREKPRMHSIDFTVGGGRRGRGGA
jgi:hypothetical protein